MPPTALPAHVLHIRPQGRPLSLAQVGPFTSPCAVMKIWPDRTDRLGPVVLNTDVQAHDQGAPSSGTSTAQSRGDCSYCQPAARNAWPSARHRSCQTARPLRSASRFSTHVLFKPDKVDVANTTTCTPSTSPCRGRVLQLGQIPPAVGQFQLLVDVLAVAQLLRSQSAEPDSAKANITRPPSQSDFNRTR